jgi:hypothetical protein
MRRSALPAVDGNGTRRENEEEGREEAFSYGRAKESRYTSADFRKELERRAAEGKSVSRIVKDLGISAETVNT